MIGIGLPPLTKRLPFNPPKPPGGLCGAPNRWWHVPTLGEGMIVPLSYSSLYHGGASPILEGKRGRRGVVEPRRQIGCPPRRAAGAR